MFHFKFAWSFFSLFFLIAWGIHCIFSMPSKPAAMLKPQSNNTSLESYSTVHYHIKVWGLSSWTLLREISEVWILPPHCLPDANAANVMLRSYGFECETAWVSEFLSFGFTLCKNPGLRPGIATVHPATMNLEVSHCLEQKECSEECHDSNLTHSATQAGSHCFYLNYQANLCILFFGLTVLFCQSGWSNTVIRRLL